MDDHKLPFKVGQLVEARSFDDGFRGAWFRCKIKKIGRIKGVMMHASQYPDFPDEKVKWEKLYQKGRGQKEAKLVLRPCFPDVYHENQLPDISTISRVVVIVNGVWKVGDLVDWWSDGCYWSARLVEILENEKFRIELFKPPDGEGLSYEASCKDFRPSLDWSPEHGWTMPKSMGSEDCCSCAQLVKPVHQGGFENQTVPAVDKGEKDQDTAFSSHISASHLPPQDRSDPVSKGPTTYIEAHTPAMKDLKGSGFGKTSCSDSVSSLHGDSSAEVAGDTGGKDSCHDNGPSKKMRIDKSISLNFKCSNTAEAAILDLEELVNRVKWMRGVLEFGMPLPNAVQPSWKFLEHRASSLPK